MTADQVDAAVTAILARPVGERLEVFAAVCLAHRHALKLRYPDAPRSAITTAAKAFGRLVLHRLQEVERTKR